MDANEPIPFVSSMMNASRGALGTFIVLVFILSQTSAIGAVLFASALLLIFIGLTWLFLYLACKREVSAEYAVRQLVASVLLTPVLLLGAVALPYMVRSDMQKWRDTEVSRAGSKVHGNGTEGAVRTSE